MSADYVCQILSLKNCTYSKLECLLDTVTESKLILFSVSSLKDEKLIKSETT